MQKYAAEHGPVHAGGWAQDSRAQGKLISPGQ
jgi:hypothetical protein